MSSSVSLIVARHRLGVTQSRFAKLVRLGFLKPEPNGQFDVERLALDYERACRYEARISSGKGLVFVEDHRAAIAAVLERVRQELAGISAEAADSDQAHRIETAIAAGLVRVASSLEDEAR